MAGPFPSNALSVIFDLVQGHHVDLWIALDAAGDVLKYAATLVHPEHAGLVMSSEAPKDLGMALQEAISTKALPPWLVPVLLDFLKALITRLTG